MKRSFAYGIVAAVVLAVVAMAGFAQVYSVYDPVQKQNVPIDRVSIDQIKAWINTPAFRDWTNMDGLEEYLADKGIDMEDLMEESNRLSSRELLSLQDKKRAFKRYDGPVDSGEKAVQDISCDADDGELEFTLKNMGDQDWFLVDQQLTTGEVTAEGRKVMSEALANAKAVRLYVNNYLVNSGGPKYRMGEKLFFGQGENFGTACEADFLRSGRETECTLEPIPVRSGDAVANSYSFNGAAGYNERGTFTCD